MALLLTMENFKILCTLIVFSLLCSCRVGEGKETELILESLGKEINNRTFKDNIIEKISEYSYDGKAFLISANSDSVWIVDNYLNQVVILDSNLSYINKFLDGGEGPSEHVGLKRVFFNSNGGYSTFDHSQQLFRIFNEKDSIELFYKFDGEKWVDDIVQLHNNTYLFPESFEDKYRFIVKNFETDSIIREYNIIDLLEGLFPESILQSIDYEKNLIFEGYFSSGSGDCVVYTCNKAGIFFVFDKYGEFINSYRTLDKLSIPKFGKREISPGYFAHEVFPDIRGNYSRAIGNGKVYILSNIVKLSYLGKRAVDVYSIYTREYLYSFFIANMDDGQEVDEISIYDNNLYVLYENSTIVKYHLIQK
jgi:hypothetical protein